MFITKITFIHYLVYTKRQDFEVVTQNGGLSHHPHGLIAAAAMINKLILRLCNLFTCILRQSLKHR